MKFSVTSTRPVEKLRAKTLLKALPQQILDLADDQKLLKKWQAGEKTMSMTSAQHIIWQILGSRKNIKSSREMAKNINHLYMNGPRKTKLWDCFSSIPVHPPILISSEDLTTVSKQESFEYIYSPIDELPQAIRNWMYCTHNHYHFHTEASDYLLYVLFKSKRELANNHIDINDLIDTLKRQLIYLEDLENPREYESEEDLDYIINQITPINLNLKNDYTPLNNIPAKANEDGVIDDL